MYDGEADGFKEPGGEMDIREGQISSGDPAVSKLLDNILDAVLALKARLADSNRDSNSLGGTLCSPTWPHTTYCDA